jgi:hypothetical protein
VRHTFRLPEPGSPEITVDNSQLTGLRVSIDGRRAPRLRERGRPAWLVPMADGSTRRISFAGAFTGLRAIVDAGPTIVLERPFALWELILAVLPFGLLGLTGVAGGVLGLIAILANLQILRQPWPVAARVLGALGCLAVAFVASYAISVLLFA